MNRIIHCTFALLCRCAPQSVVPVSQRRRATRIPVHYAAAPANLTTSRGATVATGVLAVGDAWGCTTPVGGRGMTMGLMHAVGTAEVTRNHVESPVELALAHNAMTESRLVHQHCQRDRMRTAQITAAIKGQPVPTVVGPGGALVVAMMYDATLFRANLEITSLLALPEEVFARPGIIDRIMKLADIHLPNKPPCPSRCELVDMLV
jgi:flavin-dependent dehydrogenase